MKTKEVECYVAIIKKDGRDQIVFGVPNCLVVEKESRYSLELLISTAASYYPKLQKPYKSDKLTAKMKADKWVFFRGHAANHLRIEIQTFAPFEQKGDIVFLENKERN